MPTREAPENAPVRKPIHGSETAGADISWGCDS
jgi:hypothetical protein